MMKASTSKALGVFLAALAVFPIGRASAQGTTAPATEAAGLRIVLEHVPVDTPKGASIYVAGSFNDWETNQPEYRLIPDGHGRYAVTLPSSVRGSIKFKFTLGSWKTYELSASGAEITNRQFTVPESGAATYSGSVLSWPAVRMPEDWRKAAAMDLASMHDLLRDNAPQMFVERDSAPFRQWLEAGYAEAQRLVPTVQDYNGYIFLLWGYAGGFRDSHLRVSGSPEHQSSPGFMMKWTEGAYIVSDNSAATYPVPPVGAKLLDCDGRSAEDLARSHLDKYGMNIDLAMGRYMSAFLLLTDLGNPYVAPVKKCRFQTPSAIADYPLSYGIIDRTALERIKPLLRARFGLEHSEAAPKVWRIGIPAMSARLDWPKLYADIETHVKEIRTADRIVIDLRGNGGGSGEFAWQLARRLWGQTVVDYYQPDLGPIVYPATPVSRQAVADDALPELRKESLDGKIPKEAVAEKEKLLADLDKALSEGHKFITIADDTPPRSGKPPINPMKAQVLLVTDYACVSACLDLMDLFFSMPNVYHVGTETDADTIFMELDTHKLPSGLEYLNYGHKAWIKRPRGSNVSYKPAPALTYHGDLTDEAAFEHWLAAIPIQESH